MTLDDPILPIDPNEYAKAALEKYYIEAWLGMFENNTISGLKLVKYDGRITEFDPVSQYCRWETLDGRSQAAIHATSIVILKNSPNEVKEFFDNQIEK